MPDEVGTWLEYQRLVLGGLHRLDEGLERLRSALDAQGKEFREALANVQREQAVLKVRAGAWGAVSSGVVSMAAAIIWLVSR